MVRIGTQDIGADDSGGGRLFAAEGAAGEQDPVAAMHDTEAESGDEAGMHDTYTLDGVEALEMGVDLDSAGGAEADLD
ncbi:MAG: hypothetical protein QOE84_2075 [Actinomycetota bacterium]|nr:hypothetical protein [Actinomycetota bacterium]MDT7549681.1 hypothetical protein [Actinomycetota bacterium]